MIIQKLRKSALVLAAAAILSGAGVDVARAVPAKPGLLTFDNGGEQIEVFLRGDEHGHYYVTPDGYMLLRGDDGLFRYAIPDGDTLRASDIVASNQASRDIHEQALLNSFNRQASFEIAERSRKSRMARKAPSKVAEEATLCTFPTKGSPRCLAILVEFQDVEFTLSDPRTLFGRMLNEEGFSDYGATGSARDFFIASSNGQFAPQFDVYGPVKLPYNMSYYGSNDNTGNDARPYEMIPHAVELLKDQIDFSNYDTDNDGIVDNIYIFYAGYGEADGGPANAIWPHSWNIHDDLKMEIYMNGKLINHYATSNELSDGQGSNLAGIGVFCHEFSHVMGLPDLYSTLYTSAFTPGEWSLMDHGSYNNKSHTPPYHTGYERYCLGWIEPKVLSEPRNVSMYPASQIGAYDDVYMIQTPNKSEYYILENRQQKGWDQYIPGHGLLVWHIDFDPQMWGLNIVNIEKQYVDIVEADNEQSEYSRAGDAFPGTSGVTEFTDTSVPSMKTWNGLSLHSPITDIMDMDGVVSFAFKGGENIFDPVVANEASGVKAGAFTASWTPITKTTGYLLSVYRKVSENGSEVKKYLDGFLKRELGNVSSFEVTGLDPATTYYYIVTATNGRFYSPDSNEIEVTTLDPTLDYKTVSLLPASEISCDSFVANWEKLEDADTYEISLYKLDLGDPFITEADFTNRLLPEGWTTDASFDGRASYAVETPSVRMTTDGSHLTTSSFNTGIRTLGFWYRASSNINDGTIEIEGLLGNEWQSLKKLSSLVSAAGGDTVEINDIPAGTTKIRFILHASSGGSVSIDDVKIGYGGNVDYQPMAAFQSIDTAGENFYKFSDLIEDADYGYSVIAVNSDFRSLASGIQGVHTVTSGISSIAAEGVSVITDGCTLRVSSPQGTPLTVTDLTGLTIGTGFGELTLMIPSHGAYILKIGEKTYKIFM